MAEYLRRHSLLISSVVLFICSAQLLSYSIANPEVARYGARTIDSVLVPGEKAYYEAFQSVKFLWNRYLWLVGVEEERNELLRRVRELEAHNSRLMEFDSENRRLRAMLRFSEKSGFRGVAAAVIGRDPSNWVGTITIDRGSDDGLRSGLAVVDGNAVVGQVMSVTRSSARVLLLTDNTSAIDAIVQNSRAGGVVEGGLGPVALNFQFVLKLKEFTVEVGDRVIASGLDGVFPKGSLIGIVSSVNSGSAGLFQEIEIRPSVDIHHLENVLAIIPELSVSTGAMEDGMLAMTEPWTQISGLLDAVADSTELKDVRGECCSGNEGQGAPPSKGGAAPGADAAQSPGGSASGERAPGGRPVGRSGQRGSRGR